MVATTNMSEMELPDSALSEQSAVSAWGFAIACRLVPVGMGLSYVPAWGEIDYI